MIKSRIFKTNKQTNKKQNIEGWADCVKNEKEWLERKDKQGAIGGVRLK